MTLRLYRQTSASTWRMQEISTVDFIPPFIIKNKNTGMPQAGERERSCKIMTYLIPAREWNPKKGYKAGWDCESLMVQGL